MNYEFEQHCSSASLERYVLGNLPQEELDRLEEHLLICEACRRKLDESERYLRAMRSAAARLRAEESGAFRESVRSWFALPARVWAAAAIAFCLVALVVGNRIMRSPTPSAPLALSLTAERGAAMSAPAHRILDLSLDARGFDAAPDARVELVDSNGKVLAVQPARPSGDIIAFRVTRDLDAGSYYVRLYGTGGLQREFALALR